MSDIVAPGQKEAKRARRRQEQEIARQKQIEQTRLAEEESEIARRRAAATGQTRAGRSLLIATSPTGTQAATLGGGQR